MLSRAKNALLHFLGVKRIDSTIASNYTLTVVKVGWNAPELSFWAPQNRHLAFLPPNLLSSCRNFGRWLPELYSKVLNPETLSVRQSRVSLTTYLYYDYRCVFKI